MDEEKLSDEAIRHYVDKLRIGEVYYDKKHKQVVEFRYMGQTGWAIVCEPGDSGGGMQSCWGTGPDNLERILRS